MIRVVILHCPGIASHTNQGTLLFDTLRQKLRRRPLGTVVEAMSQNVRGLVGLEVLYCGVLLDCISLPDGILQKNTLKSRETGVYAGDTVAEHSVHSIS